MSHQAIRTITRSATDAVHGRLPERYYADWKAPFDSNVLRSLTPGVRILDVGSGRWPAIPPVERPAGCYYVGLDLSQVELRKAAPGAYDEVFVADVVRRVPDLEGEFDLIVSMQVLEHVKPLDVALANMRAYLKPGGRLVVQFSGTFGIIGVINRLVPPRLGILAMKHLLGRDPETVFPAYYDSCRYSALHRIMRQWTACAIIPRYTGAWYLPFSRILQAGYLLYEEWAYRACHYDLATHYVVAAMR